MAVNCGDGFILATKFYNSLNDTDVLAPKKRKPEGKASIQLEGTDVKKQENTTTTKNLDAENSS